MLLVSLSDEAVGFKGAVSSREVEAELQKPEGSFKGAPKELTAPALALAALFAPAVVPSEYTGGFAPMALEVFSLEQQERVKKWRERPIGQFVMEVYRLHRMRCVP